MKTVLRGKAWMIDRLLERLLAFSRERSRALLVFGFGAALFSGFAFSVPLDLSFSGLMDRNHPEVARYFEASRSYGLGGLLLLLVEGPEEDLDRAIADVQSALEALPEVRSAGNDRAQGWRRDFAPWLIPRAEFDAWIAGVAAGVASGTLEGSQAGEIVHGAAARVLPENPEGARLVRIVLREDTFELALDAEDFPTVRRVAADVLARYGAQASFAGMPAIVTQEQEATLERMRLLGPLSLALVLTILLAVERRWRVLLSLAIPMLLAIGCTLSLVGLVAGELTLMESIFGVMVFGLGIDFAVHLLLRLREERAAGLDFDASLRRAFLGTGRGVLAGGLTTAGAFFILAFAPDPVFYRLGLSGGLGLSLCMLFLLLMLPAEWTWIEHRSAPVAERLFRPGKSRLGQIASHCAGRARGVFLLGALVFAGAAFQMQSMTYETNLERVFSRDIEAVETARRIQALFGVHPGVWLAVASDLEEARATATHFEMDPLFERVESLASVFPADTEERRAQLKALAGMGLEFARSGDPVEGASGGSTTADSLVWLREFVDRGPPSVASLPESLRRRLIGPDGEFLVFAYTEGATLDSRVAARERRAAQAIHPSATSMNAIYEALIGTDRPWLPRILTAVVFFIAVVIRLGLGSFRLTVLALVPAVFSLVVTMGLLAGFGFSPNTVTLVGIPLLLGLGVDDGIHVVHRMLDEPTAAIGDVVGSVARSITLTTATTCGSVGLLLFSRHPGIESVAILLVVGLPIALLATLTLMPAMAVLLGVRKTG